MYSQLSRLSTAKGLNTRFSHVGPTKVKACKSFVFTQKFPIEDIFYPDFIPKKKTYVTNNAQRKNFSDERI